MRSSSAVSILFVTLLTVFLTGPVIAGQFEDAKAAFERGDYATAFRIYKVLAGRGDASGEYALGEMYANGLGVPQDYVEAVKWYRKAAEQGDSEAQNSLGVMYADGQGVPQDYLEAVKWYRKAAERGNGLGQLNLGIMYANGQGVPKDYVLAHMWYSLSISYPMPDVDFKMYSLGYREDIASRMTPAQIAEAQRLAREWKPTTEQNSK